MSRSLPLALSTDFGSNMSGASSMTLGSDSSSTVVETPPHSPISEKFERPIDLITEAYSGSLAFAVKITTPLKDDDIVIAVMGPTGAGKSTFISAMTKYAVKIGNSLESCTSSIDIIRVPSKHPQTYGDLVFVDTPGFDDTHLSDVDILKQIYDWLKDSNVRLSGLLYFHRISDNRMAGSPLRNLRMFEKLCGKSMFDSVILVTTMWNEVDTKTGEQREHELTKNYWKPMMLLGSQTKRFLRDQDSGLSRFAILESLISAAAEKHQNAASLSGDERNRRRITRLFSRDTQRGPSIRTVLLQKEAQSGYELPNTSAGKELHSKLELVAEKRQELIQRIQKEMDDSKAEGDHESLPILLAELEKIQREFLQISVDMQRLKVPMGQRLRRMAGRVGSHLKINTRT